MRPGRRKSHSWRDVRSTAPLGGKRPAEKKKSMIVIYDSEKEIYVSAIEWTGWSTRLSLSLF